jgi:hypothetical protein
VKRPLLALYLLLGALAVAPIWSVHYLPLADGPAHVYNAWVMQQLASGDAARNIAEAYRIDWRPHPNWSGHAVMALLMFVVPPLVAEKLLLTLILVALFAGAWLLATAVDPRNDVYAFVVFAFTWPQSLIAGYYNYSLSVGLFLIVLAMWWRRKPVWLIALLLVLLYFTHPMATLFACGSIGLLSLLQRRWKDLLALIPVAPLMLLSNVAGSGPRELHVEWSAAYVLYRFDILHVFDERQRPISLAISLVYAVLIVITLIRERRRPANGLAIIALIFTASMFWLPVAKGTRDLFLQRSSLFIFLTLAAWFTPNLTRVARGILLVALSAIGIANTAINWERIRHFSAEMTDFLRSFDVIEPETTFLPLFYDRPRSESLVPLYTHAVSYVALEKRLVHLANYEPVANYFPVAVRRPALDASVAELWPPGIHIGQASRHAEYIATLDLPNPSQQRRDLQQFYRLVSERGTLRIYRRRDPIRGKYDKILLPLVGTVKDIGAPHGSRWRIEQTIRNRGARPTRVLFQSCLEDTPCDLSLRPGQSIRVASAEARFAMLLAAEPEAIEVQTTVKRADVNRPDLEVHIPAIHERHFGRGTLRIPGVPTRHRRLGLRVYLFTDRPWAEVGLRLRAKTGAVIAERKFDMAGGSMHENANLNTDFPGFADRADVVDVELEVPPDVQLWAFVSALDEQGRTQLHLGVRRPTPPL